MNRADVNAKALKVALASFVALIISGPSVLVYTQSLFLQPMTAEFGWTKSQYFLPFSVAGFLTVLSPPLAGFLADRISIRTLLLSSLVLFAVSIASLGLVGKSLLLYGISLTFALTFASLSGLIVFSKIVSLWPSPRPGLLQGITLAGGAAGGIIVPVIASRFIELSGWRETWLLLAGLVLVTAFIPTFLFVHPPDIASQRERHVLFGVSIRTAILSRDFWLIVLIVGLSGAAISGILGNAVPIVTERGFSQELGAFGLSLMAATTLCVRVISGALLDYFNTPRIALIWFLSGLTGIIILASVEVAPLILLGMVLIGASLGAETELVAYLVRRFFGTRDYGQICGWILAVFKIGSTSGPLMLGFLFDKNQSYTTGLIVAGSCMLISSLLVAFLGRYRFTIDGSVGRDFAKAI
jgi:MFS family permease